jgi:DNA-binding PadR family transcriptional regulator
MSESARSCLDCVRDPGSRRLDTIARYIHTRYIESRYREKAQAAVGTEAKTQDPSGYLPLPAATLHILLALRDGEKHGYAIMREVEDMSDGAVKMGPGTLYGSIKRMLADGFLEETAERPDPALDDQRRRYYRLTGLGEQVCDAEVMRLTALVKKAGKRPAASRRPARPRLGEA